tara:strand:+ start:652 stop:825 length:174 start_codon:yes stop_codon:yes gene_type:complete
VLLLPPPLLLLLFGVQLRPPLGFPVPANMWMIAYVPSGSAMGAALCASVGIATSTNA